MQHSTVVRARHPRTAARPSCRAAVFVVREASPDARVIAFFRAVVERTAELVVAWTVAGFVHGVLNTDNLVISGESFDYGPWRFLPTFQPGFTAAYFDHSGLYAFARRHDWRGGGLSRERASEGPRAAAYAGPRSEAFLRALEAMRPCPGVEAALTTDPAWQRPRPVRTTHDVVVSTWDAIVSRDDWQPFEVLVHDVRALGQRLRFEQAPRPRGGLQSQWFPRYDDAMANAGEREFMGATRSKSWTYLIFMVLLVVAVVGANFAVMYPGLAESGVSAVSGLPAWAFPLIGVLVGAGTFYLGLKIEADWPEAFGAFLIAGSVAAGEIMIGWNTFAFGGMFIMPYAIPLLVFLLLMGVSLVYSR